VGDVAQDAIGNVFYVLRVFSGVGATEPVQWIVKRNGEVSTQPVRHASHWTNLGPHRIEPDGKGWLRFVKIEGEQDGLVPLSSLKPLDIFEWDGETYLRSEDTDGDPVICICLDDGEWDGIEPSTPVRVVARLEWPVEVTK
jgi:hypothetical protein